MFFEGANKILVLFQYIFSALFSFHLTQVVGLQGGGEHCGAVGECYLGEQTPH